MTISIAKIQKQVDTLVAGMVTAAIARYATGATTPLTRRGRKPGRPAKVAAPKAQVKKPAPKKTATKPAAKTTAPAKKDGFDL